MNRTFLGVVLAMSALLFGSRSFAADSLKYITIDSLMIIGQGFDQSIVKYGRLPKSMESDFRPELKFLATNSAGIAVRFRSNSSTISIKWKLIHNYNMDHMAATAVRGVDLYTYLDDRWHYIGTARPKSSGKENMSSVISNMTAQNREYLVYLPLYDGVESLEIGVEHSSNISLPQSNQLVKSDSKKPIVFYGTSITQGGCASRPGMAYPSILSRMLNRETINLGFSGNGRMDFAMAKAIAQIDCDAVVLDCLPNTTAQSLRDSADRFISYLLDKMPNVKFFMVENPNFPYLVVDSKTKMALEEENGVWRELFAKYTKEGRDNIYYIRGDNLIGEDGESTVDGIHFTDLGFLRYATQLFNHVKIVDIDGN